MTSENGVVGVAEGVEGAVIQQELIQFVCLRLQYSIVVVLNLVGRAHLILGRRRFAGNRLLERNEMWRDLPAHLISVLVRGILALRVLSVGAILPLILVFRGARPVLSDLDLALGKFDVLLLDE